VYAVRRWVYYTGNGGRYAHSAHGHHGGDPALTATGASAETFGYTSVRADCTSDGTTAGSALFGRSQATL